MFEKGDVYADEEPKAKTERNLMSVCEYMKVLDGLERGTIGEQALLQWYVI
jgi:hypothetical protein